MKKQELEELAAKFRELVRLDDGRLLSLERRVNAYAKKTPPNRRHEAFYRVFRAEMILSVGWERKPHHPVLSTNVAYDIAYGWLMEVMTKRREKVEGEKRWL